MIELKHITKEYKQKNEVSGVLNDINLTINDNEIIGVVGYSGAGKSTLIRLMNGLIKPTTGEVVIDGTSLSMLSKKDLNRMRWSMGMVFQHFNLVFSMTVYQNLMLALTISNYDKDKREMRIKELIELVGLKGKENRYPQELSGGERQRVGIARALSNHPKYLLCDEATSALDQKTAKDIVLLLKHIHTITGITIIFISHQMEVIKDLCNRVVVIDKGFIVEDQSTKELFTHPKKEVTKSLIKSLVYEPEHLDKIIYELIYDHKNSDSMILSSMIKTYDVDVNIMFAKTLELRDETIGYLYLEIRGDKRDEALAYLHHQGIEVRRYV